MENTYFFVEFFIHMCTQIILLSYLVIRERKPSITVKHSDEGINLGDIDKFELRNQSSKFPPHSRAILR